MKQADAKVKAALVLGALLSYPVVRAYLDGTIGVSTAVVRVAIGLALAYAGVLLVVTVVSGYLPEPEPEEEPETAEDGVEDAVLVEDEPQPEPAEADQQ